MHDFGCRCVVNRVFWFVGVKSCFLSKCFGMKRGRGFTEIWKSNNCKGTEEMTKAVAKGCEGVVNDLGHGIAACLSGVV